jgi:CheY-like chemotaxis protein
MKTVLIIDDNTDYRISLVEILQLESYLTLEAENGQLGLQMIRHHSPNLIVCDVDMPVMNGIEVLRTVKTDPIFASIPFLIITGHRDEQTLKTSRALGVEAYLTKPITIPTFLSTIGHFLNERTSTSPL